MDQFQKGLHQLLEVLPPVVREKLESHPDLTSLVEVVMDYGRPAEVRFMKSVERWPGTTISEHEIEHVVKAIGEFGEDNRAGIERTLHRISAIRNRHDKVIGLTCRVGRALEGTIDIIDDIVRSGNSILILGKPGVGKTTKLREVARVLADEVTKRVVIVDTSNEIGGDGDIPHPAIGSARRMQVTKPAYQHQTMIEAVENHMPEVIVIDEIGNEQEALAARTIAERGVQLIGTAHGGSLENLMLNPSLCDLIGGIQAVTLSDDEAKRRGTQKTVLERKAPPTFDVVIELIDFDRLAVHHNVQKTVDLMLRGISPRPEIRVKTDLGKVEVLQKEESVELKEPGFNQRFPALAKTQEENKQSQAEKQANSRRNVVKIFPYGVARTRLERAIREKKAPAYITTDANQADVVIAIRTVHQSSANKLKDIKRSIPIITVKSNTFTQIAQAVEQAVKSSKTKSDEMQQAMMEAQKAADEVMQTGQAVELAPQDAKTRKKQHKIVESKRLATEAIGQEPKRRVKILPTRSV